MLMKEYTENNSELIPKLPKKIFNTTPKTFN